ncbi:MAG: DNA-binding protein [Candidatus Geothermarchaeales archaeon]
MDTDEELERLIHKKYVELIRRAEEEKKLKEKREKFEEKAKRAREKVLRNILYQDAYKHLVKLRKEKPSIAQRIENLIIGLVLSGRLKSRVNLIDLEWLERKITGIEPQIFVKRKGEVKSLSEFFREEKEA